jgi:hypothetical protein
MSTDRSLSLLLKAESTASPHKLKRRHDQMETSNSKTAPIPPETSPAEQRDPTTPNPKQSENAGPSTPPTAPSTDPPHGKLQNSEPLEVGEKDETDAHDENDPTDPDPMVKIPDFDWPDLEQRYHDMIKERAKVEEGLYEEFDSLMKVRHSSSLNGPSLIFMPSTSASGWILYTLTKSTDRASGKNISLLSYHELTRIHSLKTRMFHVQMSEEALEKKRQHCEFTVTYSFLVGRINMRIDIRVVKAFENALLLFNEA